MTIQTLRVFVTINDVELNTMVRVFNSSQLAEEAQNEIMSAALLLGLSNNIRCVIVETTVEV